MPTSHSCGLYLPGHNAHYIPVLKLAPNAPHLAGTVTIDEDDRLWFQPDGEDLQGPFFNHDLMRIQAALDVPEAQAQLVPKLMLLRITVPGGRAVISLASEPLGPCDPNAIPDQEFLD